jgi:hypothetical protein
MRATVLSFCFAALAWAQSSPDVVSFLQSTGAALANGHDGGIRGEPDIGPFLDHFDPDMPGFVEFHDEIEDLLTRAKVGTAIEVLADDGDEMKRELQLDWLLEIEDQRPRRKIVKCTIERVKKDWKITALDPVDFFKYDEAGSGDLTERTRELQRRGPVDRLHLRWQARRADQRGSVEVFVQREQRIRPGLAKGAAQFLLNAVHGVVEIAAVEFQFAGAQLPAGAQQKMITKQAIFEIVQITPGE